MFIWITAHSQTLQVLAPAAARFFGSTTAARFEHRQGVVSVRGRQAAVAFHYDHVTARRQKSQCTNASRYVTLHLCLGLVEFTINWHIYLLTIVYLSRLAKIAQTSNNSAVPRFVMPTRHPRRGGSCCIVWMDDWPICWQGAGAGRSSDPLQSQQQFLQR